MISISIIGAGNVAFHLYNAFLSVKEIDIKGCYNRKQIKIHPDQKPSTIFGDIEQLPSTDLLLIAVSDDAIEEVSDKIRNPDQLVVHTSGSVSMTNLNTNLRKGVFYPLQSFSKSKNVNFKDIPICIEAENKSDLEILHKIAGFLTDKVYALNSDQRGILHVAAVFVNNFVNHLYKIGNDICNEHQIPFDVLIPLIQETSTKLNTLKPEQAQTGPALRNDKTTLRRHQKSLKDPLQLEVYNLLTKAIQETYGKKL